MVTQTRLSNADYLALALAEPDRKWELRDGVLREKPPMTSEHNWTAEMLGFQLLSQLDWSVYQVRTDKGRLSRPGGTYLIPDCFVVPRSYVESFLNRPGVMETYEAPVPLVVEVWSLTTGDYDVEEKLAIYKQRGDLEIWYIHPSERTLTTWRRQPDGAYDEAVIRGGKVTPVALQNVTIDLDGLFDD